MRRASLALVPSLVLAACRVAPPDAPATTPAARDIHRDDYATVTVATPTAAVEPLARALAEAAAINPGVLGLRVDGRLDLVAAALADRDDAIDRDELVALAREAGSILVPIAGERLAADELDGPRAASLLRALPGDGPVAVGLAADADGRVTLVLARDAVRLLRPVARASARRLELALDPRFAGSQLVAVVVSNAGSERIAARAEGETLVIERAGGFAGTAVALVAVHPATRPSYARHNATSALLAGLAFDGAPRWNDGAAAGLPAAIATLRARWSQPPITVARAEVPGCERSLVELDGAALELTQRCVNWPSAGDDDRRWQALAHNPFVIEALTQPTWEMLAIRREPALTSVHLVRRFEDIDADTARARVQAGLTARWPGIVHDATADAATTELAQRWSSMPVDAASTATIAELSARRAAQWSNQPQYYRLAWADQRIDDALAALQPEVTPTAYTFGLVRGRGAEGEQRWFVIVLLALPAAAG